MVQTVAADDPAAVEQGSEQMHAELPGQVLIAGAPAAEGVRSGVLAQRRDG
ncbi:hypothetical protein G3I15_52935, partial [Streptomyces sp. SID10244]|nr:hypothetical protein [Streptomyces sp. SID10244]